MRRKYPNILRVLVALSMVFALVGMIVAPASAQSVDQCSPSPQEASEYATYTVKFTITKDLAIGDTIDLDFPDEVSVPATIGKSYVTVDGHSYADEAGSPVTVDQANSRVLVQVVTSVMPFGPGQHTVIISQGALLKNPAIAKLATDSSPYELAVKTTGTNGEDLGKKTFTIVPSLKVSPTSGGRSTTVTVTGKGWTANGGITVDGCLLEVTGTVQADGTFSVTTQPKDSSKDVTATDSRGRTLATYGITTVPQFKLTPRLAIQPTSTNVGSSITINGYDFSEHGNIPVVNIPGSEDKGIWIGALPWGPTNQPIPLVTKDGWGTEDDFEVTLQWNYPPDPAVTKAMYNLRGAQTIKVKDSDGKSTTITLTVNTPYVTFTPSSAAPNAVVTASGYNFATGDWIDPGMIRMGTAPNVFNLNQTRVDVDAAGQWSAGFTVPPGAQLGDNPVNVETNKGTKVLTTFTVGARALTLTPDKGPYGTKVILGGTNMTKGGKIPLNGLSFEQNSWNPTFEIQIDGQGTIVTPLETLKVTSALAGAYGAKTVKAVDSSGITAKATFTVQQPAITISPTQGFMGDTVTVTGTGWIPGADGVVQIIFDYQGLNPITKLVTTPDGNGAFAASFSIPGELTPQSPYRIGAKDFNDNAAAAQIFMLKPQTLVLSPTQGPVGTTVTVTGKGFTPRAAITNFGWGPTPPAAPAGTPPTDPIGQFTLTISVPGLAIGGQVIGVKTSSPKDPTTTATFKITEAPPTVQEALKTLIDKNELLIIWDYAGGQWKFYDPADPQGSDLQYLVDGTGYWIDMKVADKLIFGGKSRDLPAGWSIMAW